MLELTGLGSILRGIGLLYWLLAFTAVGLAIWKGKTAARKVAWAAVWIVVFGVWPAKVVVEGLQRQAYEREAWAYFKKKCDTEAGEKIYKTFTGVKSVLVVKPLPAATEKDLFDQFWYGDPYSAPAHSQRGKLEILRLASTTAPASFGKQGSGYESVEAVLTGKDGNQRFIRYAYNKGKSEHSEQIIDRPVSRFGISWDDVSTPEDRKYWVAGSRLSIIDLTDKSIVAERIGYFIEGGFGSRSGQRRPWLTSRGPGTTCPSIRNGSYEDRWFILSVLGPVGEKQYDK